MSAVPHTLWFRITLALVAGYLIALPVGVVAANAHWQAMTAGDSAEQMYRVTADARALEVAVQLQGTRLRSTVQTGDVRLLDGYDDARAQADAALDSVARDAAGSAAAADVPALGAAAGTWQAWADQRRAQIGTGAAGAGPAGTGLGDGEGLLQDVLAAASRLQSAASTAAASAEAVTRRSWQRGAFAGVVGPIGGSLLLLVLGSALLWLSLRPIALLAKAANRLAGGLEPAIPYRQRRDELGTIARALQSWRRAAASQRLIWQHSPVAMLVFGADFAVRQVNPADLELFHENPDRFSDRSYMATTVASVTHPDDQETTARMYRRLLTGKSETERLEKRYVRHDGSMFWGHCILTLIRDADGKPDHFVCMIEDISERRERLERASRVQRDLLPDAAPELEGYELAGVCRPSREMGGDFYDWRTPERRALTLTLGDVMGKDMPAAILMATVCTALRTDATRRGAGESVRSVAASTERDLERAGAFVTLFHARLDLDSGAVGYVDAGHGLVAVAGPGGVRRLSGVRCLPLGVEVGERYEESSITLEPGETLVVFSDGVLDVHPELEERLEAVGDLLAGAATAREMAERLVTGPGAPTDDLTAVVLRRHPG